MKKLLTLAAAILLSMGMLGGVALAETTTNSTTCSIYETGSESYNSCTNNSEQSAKVTCNNNVYVLNNNSQDAGTGGVTVTGNTTGGNAVSGSATDENNQTVSIGASCGTPATTTTPGTGAETPTPAVAAAATTTPQVVAPAGAVHAGGGAASRKSLVSVIGLSASAVVTALGVGLIVRKRFAKN